MTEEINYQALYEQLCDENEKLRERVTKLALAKFDYMKLFAALASLLRNAYFWIGYFVAIVAMWIIDKLFLREG